MVPFVMCVECVGTKYTMLVGMLIMIPFAVGELVLGLEAYLFRDFFTLQLVAHTPTILLLIYWFVVPEASFLFYQKQIKYLLNIEKDLQSPRWLIAMRRFEEAEKIIHEAAKVQNF